MKKVLPALAGALCAIALSNHSATAQEAEQAKAKPAARAGLEEVVVTARRRRESLQETPIAVSAFSGEDLKDRGIVNVKELTKSVPSLEITESVSNLIYIRGVGQRAAFARVDSTVGVYLDNIFLPRADGHLLDTVDVENIQVLRGPQGTLFGKNTTGGAMVMTLEKPNDVLDGYISGTVGAYNRQNIRGAVNMPLTDRLYSRISFNVVKDDGYFKDVGNGRGMSSKDRQSFLGQLRWTPDDYMTIDSLLYVGKVRENLPASQCRVATSDGLFGTGLYLGWPGDTNPAVPTAFAENCNSNSEERLGDLKTNLGVEPLRDRHLDTYLLATTVERELSENLSMKFIASARTETKGPLASSDQDGGPKNFNESFTTGDGDRESYSMELQFNGSLFDGDVTYTAGLFAQLESNTEIFTLINSLNAITPGTLGEIAAGQTPTQPANTAPAPNTTTPLIGILVDPILESHFALENRTYAAFFQSSWDVTEQFEATLGLRYTLEQRFSDLEVYAADRQAILNTLITAGVGTGSPVLLDPRASFINCNCTWSQDPAQLAMNLFPDADANGFNDFPLIAAPVRVDSKQADFAKLTPMISLSYKMPEEWLGDWLDSAMVYSTWSTGLKSGFFEPKGVDGLQKVEPEEVENREIGFKFEAFDRSLRVNLAFYNMDFDNQQLIQVDADSASNLVVIYDNAGRSEISGGEVEVQWMPSPGLMLNFSASSNRYEFTEFTDNDLLQQVLGNTVIIDRSDEPFPVSPEDTFSFGIQYSLPVVDGILTPRLDYSYKSKVYYGLDDGAYTAYQRDEDLAGQPAYDVVDFRLGWANQQGDLSLALFVKNVTDERYQVGIASVADSLTTYFRTYGEPRMWGLEVRKAFD